MFIATLGSNKPTGVLFVLYDDNVRDLKAGTPIMVDLEVDMRVENGPVVLIAHDITEGQFAKFHEWQAELGKKSIVLKTGDSIEDLNFKFTIECAPATGWPHLHLARAQDEQEAFDLLHRCGLIGPNSVIDLSEAAPSNRPVWAN